MKHIITLLVFFSCISVFSQNKISKKDKKTFDTFLNQVAKGDSEKAMRLVDSTYRIAVEEDNKLLEILMLHILAYGTNDQGNFNKSNDLYLKWQRRILNLNNSSLKDSLLVTNLYFHGWAYMNSGYFTKATRNLNKALVITKSNQDSITTSRCFNLLGNIYHEQDLLEDALFYFKECLKYDITNKMRFYVDSNIGGIHLDKKEYKLAEKYLLRKLEATDKNDNWNLSGAYFNLGLLYRGTKDYNKSHTFFLKSDAIKINNKSYEFESKIHLITSYTDIKDYVSAKRYMKICDSLSKGIDSNTMKKDLYEAVYKSAAKMKDHKKAFEYAQKFIIVNDSIFSKEKTKIVKELKIKYESDLKETEIIAQKKLIKTKNKQNTGLLIGLSLVLLSMISMFLSYKKRLSAQKNLLKKQEELSFEKMNTVLERQKVKTFQSHIEGQNKERERIAKDLHDSISGNLAAIKLKLSNLKKIQSDEIDTVISNLDSTYEEVRTISHNLMPQKIIKSSFTYNIQQLILLYNSKNLKINLEIFPEEELNKLPQEIEVQIHRTLQELITNIIKHAKAKKCTISIILHENYLNLIVEDNGVGFDFKKTIKGIGLNNISSRIKSMNGSLDIDSSKEKGTTININIPTQ